MKLDIILLEHNLMKTMLDNRDKCIDVDCKDCAFYMRVDACAYWRYIKTTLDAEWYVLHETDMDLDELYKL